MEQRLSLVTLGVEDLERSILFYRALGWEPHASSVEGEVAFYQAGGLVVGLWSRTALAADSGAADSGGWGGVTLAHNVSTRDEVDATLTVAETAGARIARHADETEWGGYSGVFIDPDGHPWEIAVNPGWTIDDAGRTLLG